MVNPSTEEDEENACIVGVLLRMYLSPMVGADVDFSCRLSVSARVEAGYSIFHGCVLTDPFVGADASGGDVRRSDVSGGVQLAIICPRSIHQMATAKATWPHG